MLNANVVKNDKVRLGILSKWIGREKAEEVTEDLDNLSAQLDKLGLTRKSYEALAQKGVLEELHTDIMTALAKVTENPPEEIASEVIALAMGRLLQPAGVEEEVMAEDEPMTEDNPDMPMEDDETVVEEEFRSIKALFAQVKENNDTITDIATETHQTVKDMGEIASLMIPVLKLFASAKPTLDKAKDFDSRLASLETAIKARPRQASRDDSTVATDDETNAMKSKNLEDVPDMFQGMFSQNGGQ